MSAHSVNLLQPLHPCRTCADGGPLRGLALSEAADHRAEGYRCAPRAPEDQRRI